MNYYAPWVDPRVKLVSKKQLIAYLQNHHWQDDGIVRKHFFRFRHPVKNAPVHVPMLDETDDDSLLIFEAVTELARIEDRYAGDVLTELLAQPIADVEPKPTLSMTSAKGDALAQPVNR